MSSNEPIYDAIVIGGGFYGAAIAIYLARQRGFKQVLLVEQESALLQRASYNNQARIHNGYHYPRSFTTAYRSRVNLPKFVRDWPEATKQDFTKLYAIARRNSKVTGKQFERFCTDIGARVRTPEPGLRALFEPRLIEDVYLVDEYAFDATKLAGWAQRELQEALVELRFATHVESILSGSDDSLRVRMKDKHGHKLTQTCRYLFNCTYSGLNQFQGQFPGTQTRLKHEITEMALLRVPPALQDLGVTVMDGPFFSMMPFPASGLHTLSHVRYTPHLSWSDQPGIDPYQTLRRYDRQSRANRMLRDGVNGQLN